MHFRVAFLAFQKLPTLVLHPRRDHHGLLQPRRRHSQVPHLCDFGHSTTTGKPQEDCGGLAPATSCGLWICCVPARDPITDSQCVCYVRFAIQRNDLQHTVFCQRIHVSLLQGGWSRRVASLIRPCISTPELSTSLRDAMGLKLPMHRKRDETPTAKSNLRSGAGGLTEVEGR